MDATTATNALATAASKAAGPDWHALYQAWASVSPVVVPFFLLCGVLAGLWYLLFKDKSERSS
jgi:hypothetical protein